MKKENNGCHNPGDLLLPESFQIISRKKVLIISDCSAVLVNPSNFDEIVALRLTNYSDKDEEQAIRETTI